MSSVASVEWVQWAIGVGLLALVGSLVFVSWWALFSDRARGRRRCPRCWYDLAFTPDLRCPECGHAGRSERDFLRTRRRPGVGLLGILGATAVSLYVIDRANLNGWMSYVPTAALLSAIPLADDPNGPVFRDLDRRARGGDLSGRQWRALLRRCAGGDGGARPPGDAWMAKYGPVLATWTPTLLGDDNEAFREEIEAILLTIPPRLELDTRPVWPEGVGPTVDVEAFHWWPSAAQMRIRAAPQVSGAAATVDIHVCRDGPIQRRSYSLPLPPLDPGPHEIPIELTVERRLGPDEPWREIDRRVRTLPVAVDRTLADTLAPAREEALDDVIRGCFRRGLFKWESGSLPVRVGVGPQPTFQTLFDDVAVGIRIDVLRNGVLGRQLDIWWLAGAEPVADRQHAWEVPMLDDAVLGAPGGPDDEWTVRVRGLPELALRVRGASRYWAGDVTVPVDVRTQAGAAPSRGWIPEEATRAERAPDAPEREAAATPAGSTSDG